MTYPQQQPPVMHGYNQMPPNNDWAPPPPPAKSRGPLPWLIAALVIAVLAVGGLIAWAGLGQDRDGSQPSSQMLAPATTTAEPVAAEAPGHTPKPSEIQLTAKVIDKKCFGSAGCNVDFRLELAYAGPALDPNQTWLVVYEINGIEDAPQIGSTELVGDQYRRTEESVSTAGPKSKITLKVTSVEEG